MILDSIHSPEDIRALDQNQLPQLCKELRQFLLENVSKTGGHFSSNLGVVELTVAIHRVFDTAHDRLVFDVGHQAYVHKALTGRQALFSTLRQLDRPRLQLRFRGVGYGEGKDLAAPGLSGHGADR